MLHRNKISMFLFVLLFYQLRKSFVYFSNTNEQLYYIQKYTLLNVY